MFTYLNMITLVRKIIVADFLSASTHDLVNFESLQN